MTPHELESTKSASFSVPGLISTFRSISADDQRTDNHAHVTAADLSAPFVRSEEEETRLVAQLREAAANSDNHSVANADQFWLLASIRARKGDLHRAQALLSNFIQWRTQFGHHLFNLATSDKMQRQLARRIIFVTGNVDREQRPIFNVRPRNHDPSQFSAGDTVRMLTFVLEWTLRTYPAAQTHGIVFVTDMSGTSFKNLDIRIPGVMQKAFSNNIPVRLASINMINPPFVLRAVVSVVTALLGNKLKARMRIFGKGDEHRLLQVLDKEHVSDDIGMGGVASWTDEQHQAWIQRMIEDCKTWNPAVQAQSHHICGSA